MTIGQYKYTKKECREAVVILAECKLLVDDEIENILAVIDYSKRLKDN